MPAIEQERRELVRRVVDIFERSGFRTVDVSFLRSVAFDVLARREDIFLTKILQNIDSLPEEHARELKRLCSLILGYPLIVGERTRRGRLEEGVVHERFGIPAISVETLEAMLLRGEEPLIYATRGGYYVEIDGSLLRELRETRGMSLGELADVLGVSRKTIYQYERGEISRVLLEHAIILERLFGDRIFKVADIRKSTGEIEEAGEEPKAEPIRRVASILRSLGFETFWFRRAPFSLFSRSEEGDLITDVLDKGRERIVSRSRILMEISRITEDLAVLIARTRALDKLRDLCEIPIVEERELEKFEDREELIETIRERCSLN